MRLIETVELTKTYKTGAGQVRALDGITLVVDQGEMLAVVGKSGSGKSTLMNILGCLDTPTGGTYLLEGTDIRRMSDNRLAAIRGRSIGFVFQGFNLIPSLNALENVELPLIYQGTKKQKRRALALEALERVGLSDRICHRPSQLSGGQQQRVAIARAIAGKPPMILADEPTGNLDSASGRQIMELLKMLNKAGHTIILITHDDGIAASVSRSIHLKDGAITGA